jgi:hypothetical protein
LKLAEQKEIKVRDIKPTVIDSVRFVYDNWRSVANREYTHEKSGGKAVEGNATDKNGYIQDRKFIAGGGNIKLKEREDMDGDFKGGNNPGPLPVLKLRKPKDGGEGHLKRGDSRKSLVKDLQNMLKTLGYYLGDTGPDKDGVDGDFGVNTVNAVKAFQKAHKDWRAKTLWSDGRVGPRTGDTLNRALVGMWYKKYESPRELTKDLKLVTLAEKLAVDEGIDV